MESVAVVGASLAGLRAVALADGTELEVDGFVIGMGAARRRLAGVPALDGVCTLRTIDDCFALRSRLDAGPGGSRGSSRSPNRGG